MSTRADEEREDRLYAGMLDHVSDGDWPDDGLEELAPLPVRVSLRKRPVLCRRARLGRRGETCSGVIDSTTGLCGSCFRAPRQAL